MFYSTLTRMLAIVFMVVFGTIVQATPISVAPLAESGTTESNVTCSTQLINETEDENKAGTDPSETLNNIIALFQDSATRIEIIPTCAGDLADELGYKGAGLMHVYHTISQDLEAVYRTQRDNLKNRADALDKMGQVVSAWVEEYSTALGKIKDNAIHL